MYMHVPYMYTCIYNTTDTVFHQSDAIATNFSMLVFVQLLFEGGYCSRVATIQGWRLFLWKEINDGWIRYVHK